MHASLILQQWCFSSVQRACTMPDVVAATQVTTDAPKVPNIVMRYWDQDWKVALDRCQRLATAKNLTEIKEITLAWDPQKSRWQCVYVD